jgi:hypothetical protein
VTGIPLRELIARGVTTTQVVTEGNAVLLPPKQAAKAPDVLMFNVSPDGEARLRLDVTLPIDKAMPLVRLLFDAGVVINNEGGT